MKISSKIILFIFSTLILLSFSACGAEDKQSETNTNTVIGESEDVSTNIETTLAEKKKQFDKTNYQPKINKSSAKEKSNKALKEYIESNLKEETGAISTSDFEFNSIELKMPYEPSGIYEADDYGNPVKKEFVNPYWYVQYDYTPELCDFAYFLIDAENGEILYKGYMGD